MNIDSKTCMLAKAPREGTNLNEWVLEPKYDGHRMLARVSKALSEESDGEATAGTAKTPLLSSENAVEMFARSGVNKSGKLPLIEAALAYLPSCVLDGEIISSTGSWGRVQEILGAQNEQGKDFIFVVFDVLEVMGEDVRGATLTERRLMLEQLVLHIPGHVVVQLSPQLPYSAETITSMIAAGWEGAIVKNPNSTYQSGRRSPDWVKFKSVETEDVVVIGWSEGKGKFTNQIGALVFGQIVDGVMTPMGRCSGMTDAEREQFTRMRADGTLHDLVIEVAHMGKMPTGGWRHPQFKRIRTDKNPEECVA